MIAILKIVDELVTELCKDSKLTKSQVLHTVANAAEEVLQRPEFRDYAKRILYDKALDKIEVVEVTDGDQIPPHRLEVLKELIKKVALRKIRQMEEEQLRNTEVSDERRQKKG